MDTDDDGTLNGVTDAVYTLEFLFRNGPAPKDPGPTYLGPDPTADSLTCVNGTGVIGEEGGEVKSPDGVVLTVESGAFAAPTLIQVAVLDAGGCRNCRR